MVHNLKYATLLFFCLLISIICNPGIVMADVVIEDDFEYGANAADCLETEALAGWKWRDCQDESNNGNGNGYIGVSSLRAHSGSRSLLLSFLPATFNGQTNTFIEFNRFNNGVWGSLGDNIWIDMWIYLAYENINGADMYSRFYLRAGKWIYGFPDPSVALGSWCATFETQNSWGNLGESTGLFMNFDRQGCAQGAPEYDQNLDGTYIPINQWSRLIVHRNSLDSVSPNFEAWIDAGSGLVKIAEISTTWMNSGEDTARIKIGTTFPRDGGVTTYLDSWIFIDDVKITTSAADLDWPPSSPINLSIQ